MLLCRCSEFIRASILSDMNAMIATCHLSASVPGPQPHRTQHHQVFPLLAYSSRRLLLSSDASCPLLIISVGPLWKYAMKDRGYLEEEGPKERGEWGLDTR